MKRNLLKLFTINGVFRIHEILLEYIQHEIIIEYLQNSHTYLDIEQVLGYNSNDLIRYYNKLLKW